MFDLCVFMQWCGMYVLGWLRGGYFIVVEGVVKWKVCFYWIFGCCQLFINIWVCNCGDFYVYKLYLMLVCSLCYCGDGE